MTKHSNRKKKGTLGENELLGLFWKKGCAAIRSAGSGSMRYPGPDLLVGFKNRVLAVECKVTKDRKKYLPSKEAESLIEFSKLFGAEPFLAVKFPKESWLLVPLENLARTEKSYYISHEDAKLKGLTVEELL